MIAYAYCAGIIDGEGCIYINKTKPNKKKGQVSHGYTLRIRVCMCDKEPIFFLRELFGIGCVYKRGYGENRNGHYFQYMWEVTSKKSGIVLEKVLPYLKTKKEQAELGISFLKIPKPYNPSTLILNKKLTKKREIYYLRMQKLKKEKLEVMPFASVHSFCRLQRLC